MASPSPTTNVDLTWSGSRTRTLMEAYLMTWLIPSQMPLLQMILLSFPSFKTCIQVRCGSPMNVSSILTSLNHLPPTQRRHLPRLSPRQVPQRHRHRVPPRSQVLRYVTYFQSFLFVLLLLNHQLTIYCSPLHLIAALWQPIGKSF